MARPAEPRDAEAVTRLLCALHPDTASTFAGTVRQGWRSFVAERNGEVVGFLLATFTDYGLPDESGGMIEQLIVDDSHRDRGVGRELVEACWAWLASEGVTLAFVATIEGSPAAAFYERCGFERCRGPWLVRAR
jgi:GNAT superfamily N-acetyltransferase